MRNQTQVYDAYIAGRQSAALAAAVRLGLFDALAPGALPLEELARRLGVAPRPLGHLVRALVAMDLLERGPGGIELGAEAAAELVTGAPGSLCGLIDLEVENFLTPRLVLEALRSDAPSVYGGDDPWAAHQRDPERARAFTRAMHSISLRPGEALAESVDFSRGGLLLDLGGGSGALSIALARRWPELRCAVVDLPEVCELAEEYVAGAGLEGRVETLAADFFADPLPPADAVLLSQILHDWTPERGEALLRRVRGLLRPEGRVLVHEKLVSDDGRGPLANALVDLDMLVWTEGQQYSAASLAALLERSGFEGVSSRRTTGYWSVVEARPAGAAGLPGAGD